MRILLTGTEGFTGRHFQASAVAAGHEVAPLLADLTNKDAVAEAVRRAEPDAVVHLAAISFVGHADDTAFYAVNVVGTMNLLDALASLPRKPDCVLLASSANVYGNADASPICEQQLPAPVNHYAMSKLAMEHMVRTRSTSLPLLLVRPFNYTGPGQSLSFLIPKLVDHFVRRAPEVELGNLNVEREFNDVRMVCEAYLALLRKGVPGETYNVCSGQPYSLGTVIKALEDLTGHHMEVRVNPAFVRANEVHRLCGSPAKLQACTGPLPEYHLKDTLGNMLSACKAQRDGT